MERRSRSQITIGIVPNFHLHRNNLNNSSKMFWDAGIETSISSKLTLHVIMKLGQFVAASDIAITNLFKIYTLRDLQLATP